MKVIEAKPIHGGQAVEITLDNGEVVWLDADQLIDLAEIANKMP